MSFLLKNWRSNKKLEKKLAFSDDHPGPLIETNHGWNTWITPKLSYSTCFCRFKIIKSTLLFGSPTAIWVWDSPAVEKWGPKKVYRKKRDIERISSMQLANCIIKTTTIQTYEPGSKLVVLGMVIPPLIGNPYNGYLNPYYWVDDHPLYGNNGSLDPSTYASFKFVERLLEVCRINHKRRGVFPPMIFL